MSKTTTRFLSLLLIAVLAISLCGCGGEGKKAESNQIKLEDYELLYKDACIMTDSDGNDAIVLTLDFTNNSKESASYIWSIDETLVQNGEELEVAAVITDYASFTTAVDKQFEDVAPGETLEVQTAFVLKDTTHPVKATFEQLFGKKNGTITIDPSTLSREASADSTGSTDTALPVPTGDALLDWWNGAWYGWWTMTGCSGSYESMEGKWWDACAVINIGLDYTGTVTIWDEDYSRADPMSQASVTLNSAGVGEHGTVMSESGYFTNLPLEHADWIVDPAINSRFPDVENMICIEGWYEDGEDEFYYEVYLRPWGQLWDDFAADYPDDVPYYYDDWYLPLVEAGSAMPDVVGGEAVPSTTGGTDAMTQTPGSADAPAAPTAANVSGGDGIVTEEQVQKGYVWMNEVNKNIFDATYDDIVAYFGVEGQFVKEEYSDHMKANYRYYKWISEDDDSHFIYVNFKENESGVYTVSAYNTSGFSGTEAIEKYLDIVKAEAAEANKAASANAEMKDFSVEIAQFAKDDVVVKVMTKIPVSGWSYDEGKRCLVDNDDPTKFGAGAIRFEVRESVEKFDYYKDNFENYQDIEDRVIGGITFHGRTYKYIGYDWIEYVAQLDGNRALSIGLHDLDCVPGTMPDIILNNMTFQ